MGDTIEYYMGGAVLGMAGKGCVAVAADRRYGARFQTTSMSFGKILPANEHCLLGCAGLYTDVQTMSRPAA